jgi:predicted hydrolase (HD superfamily)
MATLMIKHKEILSLLDKSEELFDDYVKKPELKSHCLEVSSIMRALSREFTKDEGDDPKVKEEKWAMTGLLHDLDYEQYPDLNTHGKVTIQRLKPLGYHDDMMHAILSHNEGTGVPRENILDYSLSACDNIAGLIYAYGLMRGKLEGMEVKGLKKKFNDKTFAAAIRRDLIQDIEKAGVPLDKFFEIAITAMQSIAKKIGFES